MNEEIKALVIKYITGNADASEKEFVKQWIGESPSNMEYYIQLRDSWQDTLHHPAHRVFDADKAFERLRGRIAAPGPVEEIDTAEEAVPVPVRRRILFMPPRVAVAVLLLAIAGIGGGIGLWQRHNGAKTLQASLQLYVPNGKMKRLILPDSTVVWLNAGTRFTYDAGFGQTNRDITLEGEGYFNVKHDDRLPFVVKAGGYKVRDVGTVFTVVAYPGNKSFETAVMEGKVMVTSDPKIKGVVLTRNEVLKVTLPEPAHVGLQQAAPGEAQAASDPAAAAQLQIVTEPHIDKYASWTDNILVFEEESFEEVARRLERTFDVRIKIGSDRLARLKYTGKMTRVRTISEAMKIIHETTPIVYTTEGAIITISMEKK